MKVQTVDNSKFAEALNDKSVAYGNHRAGATASNYLPLNDHLLVRVKAEASVSQIIKTRELGKQVEAINEIMKDQKVFMEVRGYGETANPNLAIGDFVSVSNTTLMQRNALVDDPMSIDNVAFELALKGADADSEFIKTFINTKDRKITISNQELNLMIKRLEGATDSGILSNTKYGFYIYFDIPSHIVKGKYLRDDVDMVIENPYLSD